MLEKGLMGLMLYYRRVMPSSGSPRMLHSSVVMGRLLIIYGGTNHYHETIKDEKKRCYSHDVLAYDIGKLSSFCFVCQRIIIYTE